MMQQMINFHTAANLVLHVYMLSSHCATNSHPKHTTSFFHVEVSKQGIVYFTIIVHLISSISRYLDIFS